jgi:hypothetical protein
MGVVKHPMAEALSVPEQAAREMLARGDCTVYRIDGDSPVQLTATDALKSAWRRGGDNFGQYAIKREDIAGLEKWAARKAAEIIEKANKREEPKKAHEPEL